MPLNVALDQLQQVAEQLDPLETAYAEVRFLDVDFEQLEKQNEELTADLHDEIEHEKAFGAEVEQLSRETDELESQTPAMSDKEDVNTLQNALRTTIVTLEAKIHALKQQSERTEQTRRHVIRSADPQLDELGRRIERVRTVIQKSLQQWTETSIVRLRSKLMQAASEVPNEERIQECSKELEGIPIEDARDRDELRQQVEELKWKKKRKDTIQAKIDERLAAIGKELEVLGQRVAGGGGGGGGQHPPKIQPAKKKGKQRKGKRADSAAEEKNGGKPLDRDERIDELRKALDHLETEIAPTLSTLQDEAIQEGIPLQPTEQQRQQILLVQELGQNLKVCVVSL